ncbi:hypothetical protein PVAND_015732 [Polypedilum vanderplanki]|uniref:NACHT domain-containing protein n=1 Tax=Polypedilum vanderplanki TaxID=319348 RepID=A0A9J6BDH6_POLVA|nr:hypothetical protein PVAND_015732 [Polypedilum vanderplanki]
MDSVNKTSHFECWAIKFPTSGKLLKKSINKFGVSNAKICLIINYCPSLSKVINFLSNPEFKSTLFPKKKFSSIIAIKFKIREKFESKEAENLKFEEFKTLDKILLSFESNDDAQKVIFWKNTKDKNFLSLTFDKDQSSLDLKTFITDFIINSLISNSHVKYNNAYNRLTGLTDSRGFNLLMAAVESENIDILRELLKLPININLTSKEEKTETDKNIKEGQKAADIAWQKNNQQILLELLKANSMYPKGFDKNKCSEEVEDFLEISEKLHKAIKRDNQEEVLKILNAHKNIRYFFDSSNDSAAAIAVKTKKISIYKTLIQNNCFVSRYENFEAIMEELRKLMKDDENNFENIQKELKEIHKFHFKELPKKHIQIHLSNSFFGHDEENINENFICIREAFERIDKIREGNLLLKVNAVSKNVTNNFDFNRDNLQHMVPPDADEGTDGLFFSFNEEVYFAAQKLTNNQEVFEVDGIMMHEHGHCAINRIFKNRSKPYSKDDKGNEAKFQAIIGEYYKLYQEKQDEDMERIVAWVFENYDENDWPAELIVRVPHMLGHYQNNQDKLKELKETFKSLFDYYDQIVMPTMEKTLQILENLSIETKSIKFDELTEPFKSFIRNSVIYFQGKKVKLKEISDENLLNYLTSQKIRDILNRKNLFIGKTLEINHKFNMQRKFYTNLAIEEDKTDSQHFDSIMDEKKKCLLLSDLAGTGKSTTLEFIAKIKNEKFPHKWIVMIDLKRHIKVYKNYTFLRENPLLKDILLFLTDILTFSDALEIRIFVHLFINGQVVLLFDGFDEISPTYGNIILKILEFIRNSTNNQQYITTRTQYEKTLTEKLNCITYKLQPFDYQEGIKFIEKYTQSKNLTVDLELVKEIIFETKIYENPLMLTMMVDLHVNGKLKKENFNIYSLYEDTIEMKKDILVEKGELANRDSNVDSEVTIWKVHQIYALKLLFIDFTVEDYLSDEFLNPNKSKDYQKKFIDFDQFEVFKRWEREKSKWTPDAISRTGLLSINCWNTNDEYPVFSHQTYTEFFVAKFLVESVTEAIEDEIDLNESEFEMRMKIGAHMVKNFYDFIDDSLINMLRIFISDFITKRVKEKKFKLNKKFYEFLKKPKTQKFIRILIEENDSYDGLYDPYEHYFYQFMHQFFKITIPNKKFFNLLTFTVNNRSELFQIALRHKEISFLLCAVVFDIFKNSKIQNCHKLTGFGLNLNDDDLLLPSNEVLEILSKIDFLSKSDLLENYKGGIEQFDIWNDKEEIVGFQLLYQFLCFINQVNDIDPETCKKLIQSLTEFFWFYILKSKAMIEIFFEIVQKYFSNNKKAFAEILSTISHSDKYNLIMNIFCLIKTNQRFIKNFKLFFMKTENFFQSNRDLMRTFLKNYKNRFFCLLMKNNIDKIKDLFLKYLSESEFNWLLSNPSMISTPNSFKKVPVLHTTVKFKSNV